MFSFRTKSLNRLECLPIDDRRMVAGVTLSMMIECAEIHPVLQQMGERPLGEEDAADDASARQRPACSL